MRSNEQCICFTIKHPAYVDYCLKVKKVANTITNANLCAAKIFTTTAFFDEVCTLEGKVVDSF